MALLLGGIYSSKMVILEEDTDVGRVSVREKSTRGEGVDSWVVRSFQSRVLVKAR